MSRKMLYKREFLNRKEGSAAMILSVINGSYTVKEGKRKGEHVVYAEAYVTLSDCSRQIHLDFECGRKTYKERLDKLRRLIKGLKQVEAAIKKVFKREPAKGRKA